MTEMSPKARALLMLLFDIGPHSCLHDYDREAYQELHKEGLASWMPRGWAGIGIFATDKAWAQKVLGRWPKSTQDDARALESGPRGPTSSPK